MVFFLVSRFWVASYFFFAVPLVSAQYRSEKQSTISLTEAISKITKATTYRFLYRESFTNAIQVPNRADSEQLLNELKVTLPQIGVEMLIDTAFRHILVFERRVGVQKSKMVHIQLLNSDTGERIPYGRVYLSTSRFFPTDEFGRLTLSVSPTDTISYFDITALGYFSTQLRLPIEHGIYEFNIRLTPLSFESEEVLIVDEASENESLWKYDRFSSVFSSSGESSAVKSSQILPAVFSQVALDRHSIIRGGTPDGVLVQLDGVTQFEPSHVFGLIDSYSNDILSYSDLVYSHVPGEYSGTNGGIYNLRTRSGNRFKQGTQVALTNTSARLSLDGPLPMQSGTWTLGGKTSLMNQISILGNSERIKWGLDTGREIRVSDSRFTPATTDLYSAESPQVNFYDLQGKVQLENKDGSTIQISGYTGGDDIRQAGQRFIQTTNVSIFSESYELSPVTTKNRWNQKQIGLVYWNQWNNWLIQTSSHYAFFESGFEKDDFTYVYSQPQEDALVRSYVERFFQTNQFSEFKTSLALSRSFSLGWSLESGIQLSNYRMSYEEESFSYPYFSAFYSTWLIEPYMQNSYKGERIQLVADVRFHYGSDGNVVRFSPRIHSTVHLTSSLDWDVGFVHGYQFLNRLSLYNSVASDVWIPATGRQKPVLMNHVFSGFVLVVNPEFTASVSGYYKLLDNVRMHEINTRNYTTSLNPEPWFANHHLRSAGLEISFMYQKPTWISTVSYTLSKTDLQNDEINNGAFFPAYWDRRHQVKWAQQWNIFNRATIYLNGIVATGVPAREPGSTGLIPQRLDLYRRLDGGFTYEGKQDRFSWSATISAYNLLNTKNAWYRDEVQAFDSTGEDASLITIQADILDLGFIPAMEFKINF